MCNTDELISFVNCFQAAEFDVYEKYADDMLKPNGRQRLNTLLQRNDVGLTFQSKGHGFKDAVKYVLPKLLLGPIYHCLHYFEMIKVTNIIRQNTVKHILKFERYTDN